MQALMAQLFLACLLSNFDSCSPQALARSFDVLTDPVMSYVTDATRLTTCLPGRRRVYVVAGCAFFSLCAIWLYQLPNDKLVDPMKSYFCKNPEVYWSEMESSTDEKHMFQKVDEKMKGNFFTHKGENLNVATCAQYTSWVDRGLLRCVHPYSRATAHAPMPPYYSALP